MRAYSFINTLLTIGLASGAALEKRATKWQPSAAANEKWQIILSSTLSMGAPLSPNAATVWDLDLFETDASTIASLKARGKTVMCYFSSGTSEANRPDLNRLSSYDYGAGLPDWPGERWLDLRSERVWSVMLGRIQLAAQKGCDAIDPDNIDGYSNESGGGFSPPLSTSDSIRFLNRMASAADSLGMSIGLKNAMDILDSVADNIQFAVNEECIAIGECDVYNKFIGSGKPVYHIEYGSAYEASRFCSNGYLNTVVKRLSLDGWVHYCDGSEYTSTTG
ncbi:endo alpha-1,4 polygalactosaminidase [Tothia fuscella]|uniref:alpha-galactosidase n=1 Tax=Tothia fuscella TaxID=1048955 RepID=A0A9P4NP30_9PEZI|nr:endo alpha-1,4 polygalactosaminidase [Tothia fuscella]